MTIVGFNFSKIHAEHKKAAKGDLKIGTNIRFDGVDQTKLAFDNERAAVKVTFTYGVSYEPAIGVIQLQGDVLFMQEKKVIDVIIKGWEEKKALPKKISTALVNAIMQKCTIQSIIMARDIGLPPPMPMPKVKAPEVNIKEPQKAPAGKPAPKKK